MSSTIHSDSNLFNLKNKCIEKGFYYSHLERWLIEFDGIYIIDSDSFLKKPVYYLNDIQFYFELKTFINYSEKVYFNSNNSMICLKDGIKCLNFQEYPEIDQNSSKILQETYVESNKKLKKVLQEYEIDIPGWL